MHPRLFVVGVFFSLYDALPAARPMPASLHTPLAHLRQHVC